jgi:hypothetical protein
MLSYVICRLAATAAVNPAPKAVSHVRPRDGRAGLDLRPKDGTGETDGEREGDGDGDLAAMDPQAYTA